MTAPPSFVVTRLAKSDGPLTKRISLSPEGKIISDGSACIMTAGSATRVRLDGAAQLSELIGILNSHEALALGALADDLPDHVEIITKDRLKKLNGAAPPGVVARTCDYIRYHSDEAAFALLDFDSKAMSPGVAAKLKAVRGFLPALFEVIPDIRGAAGVVRYSTSAGLSRTDTGEELPGSDGMHVYIAVQDGADIDRFLRSLHQRCWLAGLGWYMVGAAGQLLERSIVDRMVGAPERLVFEGPPVLIAPLAQDAEARKPMPLSGTGLLDTKAACPPLSVVEQANLRDLLAAEAQRLAPESAKARKAFIATRAERIATRTGMTMRDAERVVRKQIDGVLRPDVVLPFDDPDLVGTTVRDVLDDPERFEGETLADPLEGVDYGTGKAKIMLRADGVAWINSFAHGRTTYTLRHDAKSVERAILAEDPDQAVAVLIGLLAVADLEPEEVTRLRDLASERSGIGKRELNDKIRSLRAAAAKQEHAERREHAAAERRKNDPKPELPVPDGDGEWLPVMRTLNEIMGTTTDSEPPMRDINGHMISVRMRAVIGTHLLTARGSNGEETDETTIPAPEEPLLTVLGEIEVAEMIEGHARFLDEGGRPVHLPTAFVKHYVTRHDGALPVATGVATLPLVLPNGTLLSGRGLDKQRRIIFRVPPELERILPKPDECTRTAVADAIRFITDDWFVDVATDYAGKCVLASLAMTIMERLLFPERPGFFVTAGQRSSGKTTLIEMISIGVLGRLPAAASWSPNEEERRKALFSYLRESPAMLTWDNIPRGTAISCPAIERALTAESYADRVLSQSATDTVPSTTVQVFNGNNIGARGDMASRSTYARLAVDRTDPENRTFTHPDPIGWTKVNRGKILRALYTILVGNPRLAARNPTQAETRFKAWWHLVGSAVEYAARQHMDRVLTGGWKAMKDREPREVLFRTMFLSGEQDEEQTSSLATVITIMRRKWPEGCTAAQLADYAGRADEESINFRAALELAREKPIRIISSIAITWHLKALVGIPVVVTDSKKQEETLVIKYVPQHEGALFRIEVFGKNPSEQMPF